MSDDVVAELDGYLRDERLGLTDEMIERARDEIQALREARHECERQFQQQVAEVGRLLDQLKAVRGIAGNERKLSEAIIQQARDAALEEAARMCEWAYPTGSTASTFKTDHVLHVGGSRPRLAAAIRALKKKPA